MPVQKYHVTVTTMQLLSLPKFPNYFQEKTQVLKEWKTTKPSFLPIHSNCHVLGDNPHLLDEEKVVVPLFQRSEL